jgi:outer membrane protein OmpA-like peptidoglycan-associated protein
MKTPRGVGWTVVVAVFVLLVFPVRLASATSATDALRDFFRDAIAVVEDPGIAADPAQALARVRQIADGIFDMREAAPAALGAHWSARSPAEREEFTRLFAGVLEQGYLTVMKALAGGQGLHVRYVDEVVQGGIALVKTTIQGRDGRAVPIDYRMALRQGRWRIHDVAVEHVSLIDNYRAQFRHVLASEPYAALVAMLRTKTIEAPAATASAIQPSAAVSLRARPSPPALREIHFASGAFTIPRAAGSVLDDNAAWLRANPHARVRVEGHSDQRGGPHENARLAERRAQAAKEALVARGITPERIEIVTYGETRPLCTEASEECWAQNRRVQFQAEE